MSRIRTIADSIDSADSHASVWAAALRFLPTLGLSKVVFLDLSHRNAPFVRSNAGEAWNAEYTASVKSGADPFAAKCLSHSASMLTGIAHLEQHTYLNDHDREAIAKGSEAIGIRTGMSVSINPNETGSGIGWNLMSERSTKEFAQMREHHEADWRAWCQLTSAGLSRRDHDEQTVGLTTRETNCLAYVADGYRTSDIAYRLGIADGTVEMHLRNARLRLGAKTRDQAVAIGIRRRLI